MRHFEIETGMIFKICAKFQFKMVPGYFLVFLVFLVILVFLVFLGKVSTKKSHLLRGHFRSVGVLSHRFSIGSHALLSELTSHQVRLFVETLTKNYQKHQNDQKYQKYQKYQKLPRDLFKLKFRADFKNYNDFLLQRTLLDEKV